MHGLEVDFKQIMQATYYCKHEVSAKKNLRKYNMRKVVYDHIHSPSKGPVPYPIKKTVTTESYLTHEQFVKERNGEAIYNETIVTTVIIDNTTTIGKAINKLDKKTQWVYDKFININCGWKTALGTIVLAALINVFLP